MGGLRQEMRRGSASQPRTEFGPTVSSSASYDNAPIGDRKWTVNNQQTVQLEREDKNRSKICESSFHLFYYIKILVMNFNYTSVIL